MLGLEGLKGWLKPRFVILFFHSNASQAEISTRRIAQMVVGVVTRLIHVEPETWHCQAVKAYLDCGL
jgi:putative aminopeptidase FrvX